LPAILSERIESSNPDLRIYPRVIPRDQEHKEAYYGFYEKNTLDERTMIYSIPATPVDHTVLERLRYKLTTPEAVEDYSNFKELEDAEKEEHSETLEDIERDIKALNSLMKRIKGQVESGKLTALDLLDAANNSYIAAQADIQRLEQKKKDTESIANEDQERRDYQQLMLEVGDAWNEIVKPEEYPRIVYLFIKRVVLAILSPQFFSVSVIWRDPKWGTDEALYFRGASPSTHWTEEEKSILREYYSHASRKELMELLPAHCYNAIRDKARRNGLKRPIKTKEPDIPYYSICWQDLQLMQEYGIAETELHYGRPKYDEAGNCIAGGVKLIKWAC
jgi:hypothetical protein